MEKEKRLSTLALAWHSLAKNGVFHTCRLAAAVGRDYWFDWRHGVDTFSWTDVAELEVDSPNQEHGTRYGPSLAAPFRRLLRRIAPPTDAAFLDLGSGKGRAMMLAAEYGFRRVVGVEFSQPLCEIARNNLKRFVHSRGLRVDTEVHACDVVDHAFQPDEQVIYMYDPFSSVVLKRVLERLSDSLCAEPRPLVLIYQSPDHGDVVLGSGLFSRRETVRLGACSYDVYHRPHEAS